jgi:hypothetical protein
LEGQPGGDDRELGDPVDPAEVQRRDRIPGPEVADEGGVPGTAAVGGEAVQGAMPWRR